MKIIGFCGSLRKESWNRKLLAAFFGLLPVDISHEIIEIGELPLYNQDLEGPDSYPSVALQIKEKIRAADGIVLASPEFNRSVSAALKNMLEWTSRPSGDNAWAGKKVFVIGGSSGNISTALSQYHLKQMLLYLNAELLGQPEVMVAKVQEKFDSSGALDITTKAFLQKAADSLHAFLQY